MRCRNINSGRPTRGCANVVQSEGNAHVKRACFQYANSASDPLGTARRLTAPTTGRLFFAGEATPWKGENGTVQGAMTGGLRAAGEILHR